MGFTEFDILEKYRKSFNDSEPGRLHSVFPFERMAKAAGVSEHRPGRRSCFSPSAKIALIVLKSYTGFSDRQLVEHLNGNIHYRMFCGIMTGPSFPITNYKIVSAIRNEMASRLDIASGDTGIRRPRNKYADVAKSCLSYCRKRKRKASRIRMPRRRMIRLLEKLLIQRDGIHREHGTSLRYTQDYRKRLSIIRKVPARAKEMFEGRKVSECIVSIDRHYVRPIVRGKETRANASNTSGFSRDIHCPIRL